MTGPRAGRRRRGLRRRTCGVRARVCARARACRGVCVCVRARAAGRHLDVSGVVGGEERVGAIGEKDRVRCAALDDYAQPLPGRAGAGGGRVLKGADRAALRGEEHVAAAEALGGGVVALLAVELGEDREAGVGLVVRPDDVRRLRRLGRGGPARSGSWVGGRGASPRVCALAWAGRGAVGARAERGGGGGGWGTTQHHRLSRNEVASRWLWLVRVTRNALRR